MLMHVHPRACNIVSSLLACGPSVVCEMPCVCGMIPFATCEGVMEASSARFLSTGNGASSPCSPPSKCYFLHLMALVQAGYFL